MKATKKKEIKDAFQNSKIRVVLFPLSVATILYGIQLILFPRILELYHVYNIINDFVTSGQIGLLFILLAAILLFSFHFQKRIILLITSTILLMIWSMFTVSFLLSPPPNTIWIFALLMAYLTFSMSRRV